MLKPAIPPPFVKPHPLLLASFLLLPLSLAPPLIARAAQPNILWLTSEDHGPHMGCYGDPRADTPHIDALASRGLLYSRAWSCAPVCAPARTVLISGLYATSTGAEHMRSLVPYPSGKKMLPQLLREAGYFASNNAKEDYNLEKPGRVWDESSRQAHYLNRRPGQPFFAVFNSEKSHESKLRVRPHSPRLDPARVRVPSYHPDTPEVRQDWAQYYDTVTAADADAGERLRELALHGLADDTIVFYFSDHGSGMPRHKRSPYNSGLHCALVVYIPEKFKELRPPDYNPGGKTERLVSFVDFAPTMLSLAGIEPPAWMQGRAFLGRFLAPPQPFIHGFRGRMDERADLVRAITDGRHIYLRNYLPHLIYGQHISYMFQTPATQVWEKLHREPGRLTPAQAAFWNPKPPEELYDLAQDPDEVRNLANSPNHQAIMNLLRQAQQDFARDTRDLGFLPEGERFRRAQGSSPYDIARDPARYDFRAIFAVAEAASNFQADSLPILRQALSSDDSAVRYWGVMGLFMRGAPAVLPARSQLLAATEDPSPSVRIAAAHALAQFGEPRDATSALDVLLQHANWSRRDVFTCLDALASLDALGAKAAPIAPQLHQLPSDGPVPAPRYKEYVPRLLASLKNRFPQPAPASLDPAPPRPNIILVMTDDQGYGDLACHGNPIVKTPHLDRFHAESVRFTDFHVSPTCAPTRAALLSGRHEFKNGVTHTIFERERLAPAAITLAQTLQSAGYATGIFGKWHLGDEPEYQPQKRGFNEVFIHGAGGIGQTYPGSGGDAPNNDYFDPAILHNGAFEKTKGYCTDVFFNQALAWIDHRRQEARERQNQSSSPFFALITPNAPHAPLICPPEYEQMYARLGKTNAARFFGMISNIDDNFGRLLARLKDWNLERDTLVIFMTDNGGTVGVPIFNAGMRGGKAAAYQGATRVPSLWRWPAGFTGGRDCAALTAHIDVFPTLARLARAPLTPELNQQIEGRDLFPLLLDPGAPWPARTLVTHVGRWPRGQAPQHKHNKSSIRDDRFRLVEDKELYDLHADPAESKNVIADFPDAAARLRIAYDAWWDSVQPLLINENTVGPKINPFKEMFWKQFGGGPDEALLRKMDPANTQVF